MGERVRTITVRCYLEGSGSDWHAICVDLDLVAQGRSLDETRVTLDDMIESYIQSAMTYPEADRDRFLNRKAPRWLRFKTATRFYIASLFANRMGTDKMSLICHHPRPA